jgi:flagellin
MRQLAVQASNGALSADDRKFVNVEFQQMKSEITRIANVSNYNGTKLINGDLSSTTTDKNTGNNAASITQGTNALKFHIGANNVAGEDYYYVNLADSTATGLNIDGADTLNTANAQAAIDTIDSAIASKDTTRAFIGAMVNRLQNNILELQISQENAQASESNIRDTDVAKEMSGFTRAQILFNSGISMLSQANNVPSMVSQLIG